jgi:chromosome segregation ATPase
LLEQLSELSQQLKESLERLEKSPQTLEEAVAALLASRNDGFGSTAPLEESLHLLFKSKSDLSGSRERLEESKSWRKLSIDARSSFVATLEESLRHRSEAGA